MKIIYAFFLAVLFLQCDMKKQNQKIDDITPGLGEYMAIVEYHHNNLSAAIKKQNYQRADYELDELMEVFETMQKLHNNHEKLSQPLEMLLPQFMYSKIENIRAKIKTKDSISVKNAFKELTNNCNSCHAVNKMEFIIVEND